LRALREEEEAIIYCVFFKENLSGW